MIRAGLLLAAMLAAGPAAAQVGGVGGAPRPPANVPGRPPATPQAAPQPSPSSPSQSGRGAIQSQELPPASAAPDAPSVSAPLALPSTVPSQPAAASPVRPQRGAAPPPGNAPGNATGPADEVTLPPAPKITNPQALFSGLDKITGRITAFDAAIGETVQFGALRVTARACYTRPPTETPLTDGFVEVDEITLQGEVRRIFTGWMFAASPGLHAVEHPIYDVWLTGCGGGAAALADDPAPAPPAPAPAAAAPAPARPATAPQRQAAPRPPGLGR
jgi:hypothetical protein